MGRILFQNAILENSWQLDIVYKKLVQLLKVRNDVMVFKSIDDFKSSMIHTAMQQGKKQRFLTLKFLDSLNLTEDVRVIGIQRDSLIQPEDETFEVCKMEDKIVEDSDIKIIFVNSYMYLFDKDIINLEYNKKNKNILIESTINLFIKVICEELGIKDSIAIDKDNK